jgi:transcriptional regulator with XRE-family HTH domain
MQKERMGQILHQIREERKLSRQKLSQLSGIDDSYIWRLEKNKAGSITFRTAEALAQALGVPVETFLKGEEPPGVAYQPDKDIKTALREVADSWESSSLVAKLEALEKDVASLQSRVKAVETAITKGKGE